MHELFKNKGSSSSISNYRDIMLGNIPGNCFSSHVRKLLSPVAKVLCGSSQFGSWMKGGETAFAHLYVRLFHDVCKSQKVSSALIFMDIVTAFAVLLRRILFDDFDNDETWLRKLSAAGFDKEDIECILANVSDQDVHFTKKTGKPQLRKLTRRISEDSYFSKKQQQHILESPESEFSQMDTFRK